jgi:N utilization substance protein B
MLLMSDVPVSVSINEAVELAKRFGDKESRAFVNGILDRIASILGRGGRHHSQS